MITYLDASAAAKLFIDEAESDALVVHLRRRSEEGADLASCALLETELRRTARRLRLSQGLVTEVLDGIGLVLPARPTYRAAGLFDQPALRSLDALHLACAVEVDADEVVSYDRRQIDAASDLGFAVSSPGLGPG